MLSGMHTHGLIRLPLAEETPGHDGRPASINDRKMNEMKDGQNTFNARSSPVPNACKNIKGGLVFLCSECVNSQERALCAASVKHCYCCAVLWNLFPAGIGKQET